jgi:hypothetical protein
MALDEIVSLMVGGVSSLKSPVVFRALLGSTAGFFSQLIVTPQALANQLNWTETPRVTKALQWNTPAPAETAGRPLNWQTVNPIDQLGGNEPSEQPSAATAASNPATLGATPAQQAQRSGPMVMALSRGITVNRTFYPDVALTVPNGFKRDPQRFLSLSLEGTNQVRRRTFKACRDGSSSCSDIEFNAELALFQAGPASLELLYNAANVVSDSNNQGWGGQGLGFRAAVNLSPTFGIAIGGESQLDIDNAYCSVDTDCGQLKGRTLYAVASAAIPMSKAANPPVLTLSAGAGNGYYGFNGKGASDSQWGPFGSISYAFNQYIAIGFEYSGYAISGGVSLKPFKGVPLTGTLYVTDFLGNFPSYLESFCYNGDCSARVLGRLTYSF